MENGTRSNRPARRDLLRLIQGDASYVYALVTRHGAIKIGVTRNLDQRFHHMDFGGAERFLGFMPGEYADEQEVHDSLPDEVRIGTRREYYYPLHEWVLRPINDMREDMGIRPLNRRDLPRPGLWARHLPRPTREVSWPLPRTWTLNLPEAG